MIFLRYATASQEITLGPFVDSTDGDSEESGLTIANTDIKIWKAGATTLASKNSGGATYISNGVYYATLDDTDTDTLGSLVIFVHVSGALAVRLECVVLPAKVYDSLIAGSDNLEVDAVAVGGTTQTAGDLGADVAAILVDTAEIGAAGAGLTDVGLATAVKAALVDDIWDEPLTGATHNVATSAGRRLRSQGDAIGSTVNDASATTTSFVSALAGAGYDDDHFADQILLFLDGSLAGQCRPIYTYVDSTGVFTFEEAFTQAPGDGDAFDIIPNHIHSHAQIQEDAGAGVAAEVVETEGSYTVQQVLSIVLSVLAGVTASNGATLKTPDGAATRVAATIDANANRTAMTLTPSS